MKSCLHGVLKFLAGAYFLLTSLYCLLAFIPYTYLFLVKEPPYTWLIWFIRHHSLLYWIAFSAMLYVWWPRRKHPAILASLGLQAMIGIYFTATNFLPNIQNNGWAFAMSVAVLVPVLLATSADVFMQSADDSGNGERFMFSYSNAAVAGLLIAILSVAGSLTAGHLDPQLFIHPSSGLELMLCVMAAHVLLALLMLSVVNAILLAASRKMRSVHVLRAVLVASLVLAGLTIAASRFLQNTLTFEGWQNYVYVIFFSATLMMLGFNILRPLLREMNTETKFKGRLALYALGFFPALAAVALPPLFGDDDWNGVLKDSAALLMWIFVCLAIFLLRPKLKKYSLPALLAVVIVAGSVYWGLTSTAFLWAAQLGKTDGAISRALESYSIQNSSFGMVHEILAGGQGERCGDLCRTLRQYTNIHNAQAKFDVALVDHLAASPEKHPNIFLFVVDSMRQDYIGAYNPRVDFTPNLDAFARDSFAVQNAYTQYAGTTLSEPAIWTGTLLLHAHYQRPFSRVNNLEKLLKTDGYQMVVSYDSVLRQIVTDNNDLVKLDTNKAWNEFEVSRTLQQLESFMDGRPQDETRPIFFFCQPSNVHQLARNKLPLADKAGWKKREGFNNRIAYEVNLVDKFLGDFFRYLKSKDLYDNSIIIITADHGDATEEFGRQGHSSIIFPEVMRVPLLIHVPKESRSKLFYDPHSVAALTDISPTLYYLLGHRPTKVHPLFGRPLFTDTREEFERYSRTDLFLASDTRAAYGILAENGNLMFTVYDSPQQSSLWDLRQDPNATHSILTEAGKKQYEQRVVEYLQEIARFYDYKPDGGKQLTAAR